MSRNVRRVETTRLKVTLRDVEPTVLRVLDVPADSTLGELHNLLQIGVGWLDLEPYHFSSGRTTYLSDSPQDVLADLGPRFGYLYDPRARWEHEVQVLGPGRGVAGCVYGEGVCPPESSGGPRDYAEQVRRLDEAVRELFWAPHGPEFDQGITDLRVRQMAGVVPESVQLLLGLTRDGLPPEAIERAMHRARPHWREVTGLSPLIALDGILRSTGLLVQEQDRVLVAAGDGLGIVRKLRSWFSPGTFGATVAGLGVGALAARGPLLERTLVGMVLDDVHRQNPVNAEDVRQALVHLLPALTGLDLAGRTATGWVPGPSARTLLPQATALSVYAPELAQVPAPTATARH